MWLAHENESAWEKIDRKLLEWQRQHIEHVDSMSKNLALLISQSKSIVDNQSTMTAKSERFITVSEALSGLIGSLEASILLMVILFPLVMILV